MASLEQWIRDFPPVTRTWAASALLTTAACSLDLLSPFSLYFSLPLIIYKYQVWRLLTNFFFFGANFSLDFLFHMFFLVRYCRSLEEGSFRGRTGDFVWMLVLGALTMVCVAPLLKLHFLGSSLTFMLVYIWSRRNPFARMNFLGLFTFTAPYLPWVLLAFSCLLGNDGTVDLLGIGVGHIYYFAEDVYPRMIPTHTRIFKTPSIIEMLFAHEGDDDQHPHNIEFPDIIDAQQAAPAPAPAPHQPHQPPQQQPPPPPPDQQHRQDEIPQ